MTLLLLLFSLTSCLSKGGDGITVPADAAPATGGGGTITYSAIEFSGIASAETINDSQIKISFDGASGGSGIFNYRLFLSGNLSSMIRSYGLGQYDIDTLTGKYFVIVSGLSPSTTYNFTLRAHDIMQSKADDNVISKSATTVAAMTPFAGISSVTEITTASMKLNWLPIAGATRYEVYKIVSGVPQYLASPSALDTSYVITGLSPATSYTYRVNYRLSSNIIDQNTNNVTRSTTATVSFGGASSVTNPTTSSLQVNWTGITEATGYIIYRVDSGGVLAQVGVVAAPTNYVTVSGLATGLAYNFVVRYQDVNGAIDSNSNIASGSTTNVSVTHKGWTNIYAVGPRVEFRGTTQDVGNMKLGWAPFTVSAGVSVLGYNLYSSTTPNGSFTTLVNTTGAIPYSASNIIYSIPNVSTLYTPGTVYYFKLTAIVSGPIEIAPTPTSPVNHTIIKVIYPQANMSLVHRWASNLDTCQKMGRGIGDLQGVELNNHYRCEFDGYGHTPSGLGKYYDMNHDLLVDIGEIGCNFTRGTACSSHSVGGVTTTDCIGDGIPGATMQAAKNTVYFNRFYDLKGCFIQTNDNPLTPTWSLITSFTASDIGPAGSNYGQYAVANAVRLPVITRLSQTQAFAACQSQRTVIRDSGINYEHQKRLLRRKEFVAASSWPEGLTPQDEQNIERNTIPNGCALWHEAVRANAYSFNYSSEGYHNYDYNVENPSVAPAVTSSCKSRYGIQDMSGAMSEWASDQMKCVGEICTMADLPLIDSGSRENWRNGTGEYLTAMGNNTDRTNAPMSLMNNTLAVFNDGGWSRFLSVPLGLPLQCLGTSCGNASDDNTISTLASTGASLKALPDVMKGGNMSGTKIISFVANGFQNYDNTYVDFRGGRLSYYSIDIGGEFNAQSRGGRCTATVTY